MPIDMAKSALVILAAGKSSRFGAPKGLQLVQGMPFIAWQTARFREAGGGEVVVVLGHHADVYRAVLAGLAVTFAQNPAPERGAFTSLQEGLAAAEPGGNGVVFVLPVDVPAPSPPIWQLLADPTETEVDAVVPEAGGKGGHPVRLSPRFVRHLLEVAWQNPDGRLDRQLQTLAPERRRRVAVGDPAIHLNLNTQAAFTAWHQGLDKTLAPPQ